MTGSDHVFGRRGGGWAPKTKPAAGQVAKVRCSGGPYDGMTLAIYDWGHTVEIPEEIWFAAGRYVHDGDRYRWYAIGVEPELVDTPDWIDQVRGQLREAS